MSHQQVVMSYFFFSSQLLDGGWIDCSAKRFRLQAHLWVQLRATKRSGPVLGRSRAACRAKKWSWREGRPPGNAIYLFEFLCSLPSHWYHPNPAAINMAQNRHLHSHVVNWLSLQTVMNADMHKPAVLWTRMAKSNDS